MSLLVNNTLANPQTSFYAAFGSGGGGGGGSSLQSPASIIAAVDGSTSLIVPATGGAAGSLSVSSGAGAATASVTGGASATVNLLSPGPSEVNVSSTSGTAEVNVSSTTGAGSVSVTGAQGTGVLLTAGPSATSLTLSNNSTGASSISISPTGTGTATITANSSADATIAAVSSAGGGPNTASLLASNTGSGTASLNATSTGGPAALSVVSGGAGAATVNINAAGGGAAVVGVVGAAGAATLTVEANGTGNNATFNLESASNTELNIIGPNSVLQIGGDIGGAVTPGFFNGGDGVIRLSNDLSNPDQPSEVLSADVVGLTLKVKGLGGAPQVLLASQNIAIGNSSFTVPNPTGEGLYCIMVGSTPTSTQQSRQAQLTTMAYVNAAGAIQIGGNGTSTFPVGGSITLYPNEGANNMSLVVVASPGLANMSVLAFNISGPIPSAF